MMDYEDDEMKSRKSSPYMRALGDLKLLMKKKMIEDKLHYKQHDSMKEMEKEPEEKEEMSEGEDYKEDMKNFMNPKKKKDLGASIMVAIKAKNGKDKKAGKKGNYKKKA